MLNRPWSQTGGRGPDPDVNKRPAWMSFAPMEQVVKALQSVVSLAIAAGFLHAEALERGLRVYNGKPIVNSVNGEEEKLTPSCPCKKYGAAVVGLAIDLRAGHPAQSRGTAWVIARRIRDVRHWRQASRRRTSISTA